jgi:hypothetical protein
MDANKRECRGTACVRKQDIDLTTGNTGITGKSRNRNYSTAKEHKDKKSLKPRMGSRVGRALPLPLVKPDKRISRIRLSLRLSPWACTGTSAAVTGRSIPFAQTARSRSILRAVSTGAGYGARGDSEAAPARTS